MTSVLQDTSTAAPATPPGRLRGNCIGAAVLVTVQFGLGMGVNLYVSVPRHKAFFPAVSGSAVLAAHAIVAVLLLAAVVSALVLAIRVRKAIVLTAVGLAD